MTEMRTCANTTRLSIGLTGRVSVVMIAFLLVVVISSPTWGALSYDPAASTAVIDYYRDSTAAVADAFATGSGAAWYDPGFISLGPSVDSVGSSYNSYYGSVAHSVGTTVAGQAVAINMPYSTMFGQVDPGGLGLPESELYIGFDVQLVADAGGGTLDSLPVSYSFTYDVPLGSSGEFHARFSYDNLTTGAQDILPAQAMDYVVTPGTSGTVDLSISSSGFVGVAPGDRVAVSGYFDFLADNTVGPVGMTLVPAVPEPGSLIVWSVLGLAFGGAIWRRRRRRATA